MNRGSSGFLQRHWVLLTCVSALILLLCAIFISVRWFAPEAEYYHSIEATEYVDDYTTPDPEYYAEASYALEKALGLKVPSRNKILYLAEEAKYDELEKTLLALERDYKKDPIYESPYIKGYQVFNRSDTDLLAILDDWVKNSGSYMSYGARGFYKSHLGWKARGHNFADDTPDQNFKDMRYYMAQAEKDMLKALELNPGFVPGYNDLISTYMAVGNYDQAEDLIEKVFDVAPGSYYPKVAYMDILCPRWGGSYEEMKAFAERCAEDAYLNPRIWSLQGIMYADMADSYFRDEDYESAIREYSKALSYGDRTSWLQSRGSCYHHLGRYTEAMEDYRQYLSYKPNNRTISNTLKGLEEYCEKNNCQ